MSAEVLSMLAVRSVALTPKDDKQGIKVRLKVFWKTTRFWTPADIADFQKSVPNIAERLRTERYWNKNGDIRSNTFTCEDFAIRVLCEYAAAKELPVKLTTGVRTFRNMEIYNAADHDRHASNIYGFSEMVMLSYGAPDMQRTGVNTIAVDAPEELLPGDILAQAYDRPGSIAHHIQIVETKNEKAIKIVQGNSSGVIVRPFTTVMRWLGSNRADPQNKVYAGMSLETGIYTKSVHGWDYTNIATRRSTKDFLKAFQLYRWNFAEFNK